MKVIYKYLLALIVAGNVACSDFLDEYSQDLTYAKTAADLDEILVGDGYWEILGSEVVVSLEGEHYFPWMELMSDDAAEHFSSANTNQLTLRNMYVWAPYPYMFEGKVVKDNTWPRLYKHISVANVVLSKCEEINDLPLEIERIKGESYFIRALNYYFLVNLYAKPYQKQSATQDMGVPVKTTEYVEDVYFTRNTVAEVYEQILSDLENAARLLKGKERKSVYRADYYAVQALLSRVYLYMEEYDKALAAADSVLIDDKYSLLDYNNLELITDDWGQVQVTSTTYATSPEIIFSQGGYANWELLKGDMYQASTELVEILKQNAYDLRGKFYVYESYYYGQQLYVVHKLSQDDRYDGMASSNCLLRLPEVLLNKAEALAQLGRDEEACEVLDELRRKRMDAEVAYEPVRKSDKELIDLVREERRKELCFEGHRWFDLRRYAVNTNYPFTKEIVHDIHMQDADWNPVYQGSYCLKGYDEMPAAYVLPIPQHVIEFNKGSIKDNDPRPELEMFNRE